MQRRLAALCTLTIPIALACLLAAGCRPGDPPVTPTPTKTRIALALPTITSLPQPSREPSRTPTSTPVAPPSADAVSPSPPPPTEAPSLPVETSTALPSAETLTPPPASATATSPPTARPPSPSPPTATATAEIQPSLEPQQGGEWDMEAGFQPGRSPLGEDCPGWAVAVGWKAFAAPGSPASSCLNENKNSDNVRSGERSQELTFDFISAEAGITRQAKTLPGHHYRIEAWGKHIRSASPVELSLGVDLTGGENWQAASVTWHPWDETAEETWVHTQVTVRASGETLTVFLKGYHPFAAKGGATLFDDVRVADLGP